MDLPPLLEPEPQAKTEVFAPPPAPEVHEPAATQETEAPEEDPPELKANLEPTAPQPPPFEEETEVPEAVEAVRDKGSALLESILRSPAEPLTTSLRPPGAEVTPRQSRAAYEAAPQPIRPIATDARVTEVNAPGMGEMMERHIQQRPVPGSARRSTQGLGVEVAQMDETPRERKERRMRTFKRGVITFFIIDICIAAWFFGDRLIKWWRYEPQVIHKAVALPSAEKDIERPEPSAPTPEVAHPPAKESANKAAANTKSTPIAPIPEPASMGMPAPLKTVEASQPAPKPEPAKPEAPPSEPPLSLASLGKTPSVQPAEIPQSPPTPPPVPSKETKPLEPAPAVKAIPLPAESSVEKSEERPSDRALAGLQAKVGAFVNPIASDRMPLTNEPLSTLIESDVPKEAEPALRAVKAFLSAQNWNERLKWCQRPDAIRKGMEEHYSKHPDGPVTITSMDFVQRIPEKNDQPAYSMFEVKGPSLPHSVLMLVDQPSSDTARVDWEAFVEFQNDTLKVFNDARTLEPARFRVNMRRRHAFERSVPDLAAKDSFEVSHPGSEENFAVYVAKSSETGRQLANKLPWSSDLAAIVELVWRREAGREWMELKAVSAYGWKN